MPLDLATALAQSTQAVRPNLTHQLGYVTAFTSSTVTVRLAEDTATVTCPKIRAYTPVNGDLCLLLNARGALYAIGALNASSGTIPDPDEDNQPPAPTVRTRVFRPGFTGTWRGPGWRGDTYDVLQGDWTGSGLNWGAAYYGNGPAGLSGTAVSGTVKIRRASGGSVYAIRPYIRLLNDRTKPSTFPDSYGDPVRGPAMRVGDVATIALPKWWVQRLMDGQSGGLGAGRRADDYIGLLGRNHWPPSMELTIKYK